MGFGATTIGNFGCLITGVGMLVGRTPAQVNEDIKRVNGFVGRNRNLLVWVSLNRAYPNRVFFHSRNFSYNNWQVLRILRSNEGCLVEVNGARIGGTRHWVVFIGGQRLIDPWDGKNKPTNHYLPLRGYADLTVR